MIISQTPFRVSLFGGGSDFPEWFEKEDAQIISGTIDKFAYISLRDLPPFFEHRLRAVYSVIEAVEDAKTLKHPAMREILSHYLPGRGVEVTYQGDLPAQSGVGTSSSFTVGLIAAVKALVGNAASREELAREAIWVEQDLLREKVGLQDQIAASYGGLNHIRFGPAKKDFSVRSIRNSDVLAQKLESSLVLVFSGQQRFSSDVQQSLRGRAAKSKSPLKRTVELVTEFLELSASNSSEGEFVAHLAELLDESWTLKKMANPSAVTNDLESLRHELKTHGAQGVKILGAGGGGFLLAAAPPEKKTALIQWVNSNVKSYALEFKFVDYGARIIHQSPSMSPDGLG